MAYAIELKPAAIRGLAKVPKGVQKSIRSRIDASANNRFFPDLKRLESELHRCISRPGGNTSKALYAGLIGIEWVMEDFTESEVQQCWRSMVL